MHYEKFGRFSVMGLGSFVIGHQYEKPGYMTLTGVNLTPRNFRARKNAYTAGRTMIRRLASERLPCTGRAHCPVPNRSAVRAKSGSRTTLSPTYAGMNGSAAASNHPSHPQVGHGASVPLRPRTSPRAAAIIGGIGCSMSS